MTMTDWIQAFSMVVLVGVTIFYAWHTRKMAEEMRKQRLSEARPYLLIRLAGEVVQWDTIKEGERRPSEFKITIRNVGNGPAINLWAALWGPTRSYFGDSKGYLAPDEEWQVDISRVPTMGVKLGFEKQGWLPELVKVVKQENPGTLAVKYQDVHKRSWATYLILERNVDVPEYVMEGEQDIVEVTQHD